MRGDPVDERTTKLDLGFFILNDKNANYREMCEKAGIKYTMRKNRKGHPSKKKFYLYNEFSKREEFKSLSDFERKKGLPVKGNFFSEKEFDKIFDFEYERCYLSFSPIRKNFDSLERIKLFLFNLKAKLITEGFSIPLSSRLTDIRKKFHIPYPKKDELTITLSKYFDVKYYPHAGNRHFSENVSLIACIDNDFEFFESMNEAAKYFQTDKKNIRVAIDTLEPFPFKNKKWTMIEV